MRISITLLFVFFIKSIYGQMSTDIIAKVKNAVVLIKIYDYSGKQYGHGSGFIIDKEGNCVTNYHVLKGAYSAKIKMDNGQIYVLDKIIGINKSADLVKFTLIKGVNESFPFVKISASKPKQGETVGAIGTPEDEFLFNSYTEGVIAGVRNENGITILQTDAAISFGSSGGVLFNSKGEAVGITSSGIPGLDMAKFAIYVGELNNFNSVYLDRIFDDALVPVKVSFFIRFTYANDISLYVDNIFTGKFKSYFTKATPLCEQDGTITTELLKGYHTFSAYEYSTGNKWEGSFTLTSNECFIQGLSNSEPKPQTNTTQQYQPYTPPSQIYVNLNAGMGSKSTYNWMISSGLSFVNTGRGVPLSLYMERYNLWHKYSVRANFQYLKAYQDFSKNNVYALDYYSVGIDFKRIFSHELKFWDWYIAASFNLRSSTKNYSRPEFVSNGVYTTSYLVSVNKSVGFVPAFRLGGELRLSPKFSLSTDVGLGYNTSTNLPVADLNFLLGYRLNFKKK